jgi:hypothetical protein
MSEETLLSYGVPTEWLQDVRFADEDTLLDLAEHLPAEAAEALLEIATGGTPRNPEKCDPSTDPFKHPDARQRFRVVSTVAELAAALDYPWEKWSVFLHPSQREAVERDYSGPARVSGSAGTGKTIVALHRAVYLARANPNLRILLTTFSDTLARALLAKLRVLLVSEPGLAECVEVEALNRVAIRLYERTVGIPLLASAGETEEIVMEAALSVNHTFSNRFLVSEWRDIVDAWQLGTWEAYRDVARLGRKTRLPEKQRAVLWSIFETVRKQIRARGLVTISELFNILAQRYQSSGGRPFDFIIVDESQDLSVAQLRFLSTLGRERPNSLFFAGDLGQRIFQQPFSWKALGVDVRGRSRTLRINYRTSHQIRGRADRLLAPEVTDVDGALQERRGTISVFNGPEPDIRILKDEPAEKEAVSAWLRDHTRAGLKPHEFGVFVRSTAEVRRAQAAVDAAGLTYRVLDEYLETESGRVSISTMHLAKGLEFRAVAIVACDDEIIPSQDRIDAVADEADLEEVYNTERHLLYVACTRARDFLLVTGAGHGSEFLEDLTYGD